MGEVKGEEVGGETDTEEKRVRMVQSLLFAPDRLIGKVALHPSV